ncbi:hypothetical protein AB0M02_43945 [Actinoplanes sp. NPDC051861]|uniref:hypothetical protein n=1 Tax=Actinoplanes sp. NPDC051861 TaxID=3155170 RepID=UPI0034266DDD
MSESEILRRRFSPERLEPYLGAADGDLDVALDLYAWNADLSADLSTTIGHVEVLLRNAIHQNLTEWSEERFGEPKWFLDPGHRLQPRAVQDIAAARRRATRSGRPETPGRVVAELSFGFWRFLLANHYDGTLWRETLYRAFPGQARRRPIHDAAAVLHLCRNRLAHHEPVFNRPVDGIHASAVALADWICPVSRGWIERHSRAPDATYWRSRRNGVSGQERQTKIR